VQARVVGDYEHFEVGQVAEGEHADFGELLAVGDHYCLQPGERLKNLKIKKILTYFFIMCFNQLKVPSRKSKHPKNNMDQTKRKFNFTICLDF
jgi:hypothetical protein